MASCAMPSTWRQIRRERRRGSSARERNTQLQFHWIEIERDRPTSSHRHVAQTYKAKQLATVSPHTNRPSSEGAPWLTLDKSSCMFIPPRALDGPVPPPQPSAPLPPVCPPNGFPPAIPTRVQTLRGMGIRACRHSARNQTEAFSLLTSIQPQGYHK